MNFLKNFFDDDSAIIGLCGFKQQKSGNITAPIKENIFLNNSNNYAFQTNFANNTLLI